MINQCPYFMGSGPTWRQCPNKGKYKQYPNDSANIPRICGVHIKRHRKWQKMINGVTSDMLTKMSKLTNS